MTDDEAKRKEREERRQAELEAHSKEVTEALKDLGKAVSSKDKVAEADARRRLG